MTFRILCLIAISLSSCKISRLGKDQPSEASKEGAQAPAVSRPVVQPQQQQGSYHQTVAVTLTDEGVVKEKLSLRLDYFAPSKPGGVTLPSCYESMAGHLVIGRLVCVAGLANAVDVQANQLDQICHTDNATPTVAAKSAVSLVGCKGNATLQVYKFEPQIKVDVQVAP